MPEKADFMQNKQPLSIIPNFFDEKPISINKFVIVVFIPNVVSQLSRAELFSFVWQGTFIDGNRRQIRLCRLAPQSKARTMRTQGATRRVRFV